MKDIMWEALQNQPDIRNLLTSASNDLSKGVSAQQISAKLSNEYQRSQQSSQLKQQDQNVIRQSKPRVQAMSNQP